MDRPKRSLHDGKQNDQIILKSTNKGWIYAQDCIQTLHTDKCLCSESYRLNNKMSPHEMLSSKLVQHSNSQLVLSGHQGDDSTSTLCSKVAELIWKTPLCESLILGYTFFLCNCNPIHCFAL